MRWTKLALSSLNYSAASRAKLFSQAVAAKPTTTPWKRVFLAAARRLDVHIITTRIEHSAVINPCRFLEKPGAKVTYLPVAIKTVRTI
jgi:selenocysteine lyase/cysteine desulfurase